MKIFSFIPVLVALCLWVPGVQAAQKKAPEAKEATRVVAATKHLRSQPAAVAVFARGLC